MNKVEFEPEHLLEITTVEQTLGIDYGSRAHYLKRAGPCATIMVGDKVGACGGISTLWPKSGEAWILLSQELRSPSLLKMIRENFEEWVLDYTRIQGICVTGWEQGERLLEFLGFHFEVVLKKFGPNEIDQSLYVRLR